MITKDRVMPVVLIVVGTLLAFTISAWAGALGRIDVLTEQAEVAEGVTTDALEGEQEAVTAMNTAFEEAAEERVEATLAIAEVRADLIVQEGVAETSFRRAELLAADNPVLEQAIQEMRGDAIVASMKADSVIAVSAASLLTAQLRIITLERLDDDKEVAHAMTIAAFQAEIRIKDQIIAEQGRALSLSFFPNLFQNAELAVVSAVVGGAITYLVVQN